MIKKVALNFDAKFWWLLMRYHLSLTAVDNLLTLDGEAMIVSMMADINFTAIIKYNPYERAFSNMTILLFSCLV